MNTTHLRAFVFAAMTAAGAAHTQESKMTTPTNSSDEKAINQLHQDFIALWNKGDADGLARYSVEDGVRVGASGDIAHGRAAISASFAKLFNGAFKGATVTVHEVPVRFLGPDYALWESPMELTSPAGKMEGYVVDVMVKRGGTWAILEMHPKLYPAKR